MLYISVSDVSVSRSTPASPSEHVEHPESSVSRRTPASPAEQVEHPVISLSLPPKKKEATITTRRAIAMNTQLSLAMATIFLSIYVL
ncbi:hypothetical protein MT325_m755L [Paramecium bursaria chlorella virus MT325]|uniref:Uncharacterized protein m755L n=2 Tax=Paramecium bursaria Chlorella virus A1 TaxID=381899 RepID=A7IVD5_PBCVM|nr:hypothetical protein FR483_n744L [Paramecium bursaria Chlorella virus FR483]ABT14309.1 hypothetical protein MT325_m755L [Paramecium bursaria chlorella virus MT325]ABT16029.1 hypothetical protein FR483_n744L [Paramecium bursaria Chlorella virus FR483]